MVQKVVPEVVFALPSEIRPCFTNEENIIMVSSIFEIFWPLRKLNYDDSYFLACTAPGRTIMLIGLTDYHRWNIFWFVKCKNLILLFFTFRHCGIVRYCQVRLASGENFCHRWFSANATCQMARNGSSLVQSRDLLVTWGKIFSSRVKSVLYSLKSYWIDYGILL